METERIGTDAASLARAAACLRSGGLVAFPTETVYGLGARADDAAAVRRIFEAKGRPADNPVIVHVAGAAAARALAAKWPARAEALAAAFWPGPLTLVVARDRTRVPDVVAAGGPTVALRCPAHPVAQALLRATGLPLAAPSANRSTSISPTTADHVLKTLAGRIDLVVDGGPTGVGPGLFGIESTIVDVTVAGGEMVVLRHGAIGLEELARFGSVVDRADRVTAQGERAQAPGALARHYAPVARLRVVAADRVAVEVADARAAARRVAVVTRVEVPAGADLVERLPADPAGYAAGLYAALHRVDDAGCDDVLVVAVPESPGWAAVRDRLRRAAVPGVL